MKGFAYSIFGKFFTVLAACLLLFPLKTDGRAKSTDSAALSVSHAYFLGSAALMGQGITNDGSFYYTSGAMTGLNFVGLAKINMCTHRIVKFKACDMPYELYERGNNHFGDISCCDGRLYVSVEDDDEKYPCIAVFDCETLEYICRYDLDASLYPDGIPWCTVDKEQKLLYATGFSDDDTLEVYDLETMSLMRSVKLSEKLYRIQGGEVYDGMIYLSQDQSQNSNEKNILKLDPVTGKVSVYMIRDVGSDNVEAEGMTITDNGGSPLIHVLDYNKIATVYLRVYS